MDLLARHLCPALGAINIMKIVIQNGASVKRLLIYLIIPFVGAVFLFNLTGHKEEVDIFQGKAHYGTLILSSEIEGLPIYINYD